MSSIHTCRICGWTGEITALIIKEMHYGTKEAFEYFECGNCHCLQIAEIPQNLRDYYETDYYSYKKQDISAAAPSAQQDSTPLLDVGCGSGGFLCKLAQAGYTNLTGCDPFIENDIVYENGVHIYKKEIHEMTGQFDGIFLNDSFEHVTDPHEVLDSVKRLLSPKGVAQIKIPVHPNIAFELFKENWYQLDAPRHIFIHTKESMEYLAKEHGLTIIKTQYDSNSGQIIHSYLYTLGYPLCHHSKKLVAQHFPENELKDLRESSDLANQNECGDHAIFYVTHANII